ncbi:tRNA preQ1(34) S-adenosylmethionine ribosyltransferase-isomerase QueA [Amylibacter sp. SFDW26]|uniref:tRNA preQ1(34) S-adenosylmethionine ribosyltransferase-isomerase QueA n=1 Tax=Amylibacter sp. SFDW26 TaxID=2652722 RepID=UPI00126152A0|nr:tRNA preQ1(34) S-adenosylmethionine ribosyltransferase-isomerase QueA [Amylibacter sp. SFDW26]KAB7615731.1 tRNA preQ1(34) S-adenosylmethionine ribosyltransferase-isomerase QueA [Amylibacter sp. SFDW26]
MYLSDFDFNLPEELIALRPLKPRPSSRLLISDGGDKFDHHFSDICDYLQAGDRLVLNNTKVIPARLNGRRRRISDQGETFAAVEITLISCDAQGNWLSLAKPARRLNVGEEIYFDLELIATVISKNTEGVGLSFNKTGKEFDDVIANIGIMPLPPYIAAKRPADEQDHDDYQTVFAKELGAVAAPTASLHFDEALMDKLNAKGITFSEVTLHVGAGTFLPVKTDDISAHKMHSEWGHVSEQAATEILDTKEQGGRVIPVGTTALRLIETAARDTGQIQAWTGDTDIFIKPGFQFYATDGLITNFHLPKSTLLMLVSALIGLDRTREIYEHAIEKKYRFFSYGDGSLLFP